MTAKTVPQVRKARLGKVDLSAERDWMRQHAREYRGQWVVLGGGRLVGHTADLSEVSVITDKARAEGIRAPYVKFISDNPDPVWMGWL